MQINWEEIPPDMQLKITKTLERHPNAKPDHQRTVKRFSWGLSIRTNYRLVEGDKTWQEWGHQIVYDKAE